MLVGGGHVSIIGDGAGGAIRPSREACKDDMTCHAKPPRRSSNATTRFLAAAGLVGLLGGMAFIVMGETVTTPAPRPLPRRRDRDGPPPVKKPPGGDEDRRHRGRRLRPGGRPVRERRRCQARDRRQRHHSLEDRALPDDVQQVGRRPRARRRQAGEGVARRRHDRDAGLRRQVQVGNSPTGPFTSVSGSKTTAARTAYALKPRRGALPRALDHVHARRRRGCRERGSRHRRRLTCRSPARSRSRSPSSSACPP